MQVAANNKAFMG